MRDITGIHGLRQTFTLDRLKIKVDPQQSWARVGVRADPARGGR
ncbi:hypothetical protein ACIBSV_33535 [Embleya sp. NPDC050154]